MNAHSLRVLEFGAVRALLAEHAACALGRERAEALAPLTDPGEVRDEASALLQRLRREAKVIHGRIMERLQSMLRAPAYRDLIQEPIITVRDDRYCIPVKSECRSQFGGLVHDQSSSGATVFMEP